MNAPITASTQPRERTSCQPERSAWSGGSGGAASPRGRGCTRRSRSALSTNVAASSANASPAPTPSTSAVASAGPTRKAMFDVVSVSARASWMSDSGTVWGTRPL